MINEDDMEKALSALSEQLIPNYTQIAMKYAIHRTTLMRRHQGKTSSRTQATSLYHKLLTDTQEEALIDQINKLTIRGLPPTSYIVKNLVEEIRGCAVGKNWMASFVSRHKHKLKSLYLNSIDNLRVKGEYLTAYKLFFNLVRVYFMIS